MFNLKVITFLLSSVSKINTCGRGGCGRQTSRRTWRQHHPGTKRGELQTGLGRSYIPTFVSCLTLFACGYCLFKVLRLQRDGQCTVLLRPTKVLFSHKTEGTSTEELRTVVAYQNPFTGDYCVHKSRLGASGYVNGLANPESEGLDSPDSGMSDEYEPLNLEAPPRVPSPRLPPAPLKGILRPVRKDYEGPDLPPLNPDRTAVNKTWNWNYKEYQI